MTRNLKGFCDLNSAVPHEDVVRASNTLLRTDAEYKNVRLHQSCFLDLKRHILMSTLYVSEEKILGASARFLSPLLKNN